MAKHDLITKDFALYVVHYFASMLTWRKEDILSEIDITIKEAKPEDAVQVVHGRWNKHDWGGVSIKGFMVCSACNVMIPTAGDARYCLHRLNYCPNCGAKMDRGNKDG